ncbi:MAG: hypothetical protein EGP81_05525 [Bacteroides clarus]|nr:hypothetical protein [Bacteroides clarus]
MDTNMKKILFLLAILPMIVFTACSDDDKDLNEYETQLVGTWQEVTEYAREVFNVEFKSDKTGYQWAENNGEIDRDGKEYFIWSATKDKISITLDENGSASFSYAIKGSKLYISSEDETIIYARK